MAELDDKVVLVTGAARGLGEAVARRFVAQGARVWVTDVLDESAAQLARELGDACRYRRLDVTLEQDWQETVAAAVSDDGRIDALVNNAAILKLRPLVDCTLEDYLDVTMVNQVGCFLGMRAVVPAMREHGGSIVNVSSTDGLRGMAGTIAYGASKWALRGMSKTAAIELGPLGIRVNSVHPGGMETPMSMHADTSGLSFRPRDEVLQQWPLGRSCDLDEVAQVIQFLASQASSYCTGGEYAADGGQTAGSFWTRVEGT